MKGNRIYSAIRLTCLRHTFVPLIAVAVAVIIYYIMPFSDVFYPTDVYAASEANKLYASGHEYVDMHIERLYYTGFDIMERDSIKASYYYEITNSRCTFYILGTEQTNNRAMELENVDIKVKLEGRDGLLDNMMSSFASSLGWTADGMLSITNPMVVNQTAYKSTEYVCSALFAIIFIDIVYNMALVTINILFILFPQIHISLIRYYASRPIGIKKALCGLKRDFSRNIAVSAGDMYLSNRYFYNLGRNEVSIMPLRSIVMGYEYSKLRSIFGRHIRITHTLCFRGRQGQKCMASGKTIDDVTTIAEYLKERYPDILWGHTKENAQLVKELQKEYKRKERLLKKEERQKEREAKRAKRKRDGKTDTDNTQDKED